MKFQSHRPLNWARGFLNGDTALDQDLTFILKFPSNTTTDIEFKKRKKGQTETVTQFDLLVQIRVQVQEFYGLSRDQIVSSLIVQMFDLVPYKLKLIDSMINCPPTLI